MSENCSGSCSSCSSDCESRKGPHVFQRPRGLLFMVGFKRKDLVFFYGIMLFTA